MLAALGASIAGGIVGSYIVVKRIVSISGSIAHSILGGVGIALWLQYQFDLPISPLHGAIACAIFVAICIGNVHLKYHEREDSIISMIWSIGMAVGMFCISKLPLLAWDLLLLILTAMTTVVLMYVMGVILMLSMLVLPVSIACRFSFKMSRIIYTASILNMCCSCLGIILAYILDLPVGPVIAILMGAAYSLSLLLKRSCNASTPSPVSPDRKINC